jgi:hypothetical protein
LYAPLNCAQASFDRTARRLCSTRRELLDLSLKLSVFFDQLGDHSVQLLYQVTAAEPASRRRLASWWTASTLTSGCLLRAFVCHFGS